MLFEAPGRPGDRQLRQFAWALIVFVTIVLAVRVWRGQAVGPGTMALTAAGWVLGALGALSPRRIEWLFVAATTVTRPIGLVVSELMIVLIYFGVITPVAILARLVGRDRLQRTFDRRASSYWVPRKQTADPSRYFRES
jgi:hypothetical protein